MRPPGLIDITHNGKRVQALAQVGKSGYMFILDRVTGKPVYGVEEQPVDKSNVPGEASFPTQPFPAETTATGADDVYERGHRDCRGYDAGARQSMSGSLREVRRTL